MHFTKILPMVAALAMLFGMPMAVAQDAAETEGIAHVVIITAKDGQAKALEEGIVKYHHLMGTKQGALRYQWFAIIAGENTGKYVARSGDHNWADFDAEHDWDKEAGDKFASLVQPHIADTYATYTQRDDEMGMWPDSMEGYQFFSVTQWHIKQGQSEAFNEGLKKIDGILKANGFPNYYSFDYTVIGGHGNMLTLVSPAKNFADMADKKPSFMEIMNKAMGEKEASTFMSEWAKTYKAGDNALAEYMAEQSDYGDSK